MALALGYTITELQNTMNMKELYLWSAYREKFGPMNDIRRYDRPAALIGSLLSKIHNGKLEVKDLLPYNRDDNMEVGDDFKKFVTGLGSGIKIGKRKRR